MKSADVAKFREKPIQQYRLTSLTPPVTCNGELQHRPAVLDLTAPVVGQETDFAVVNVNV